MSFIRFDHLVISIFLMALFTIGIVAMITDLEENYDDVNMTSDEFKNMTSIISDTFDLTEKAKNKTLGAEISGADESWESMTKGSYKSVREATTGSFSVMSELIFHVGDRLMIPPAFLTIGFSILVISLVFAVVYMIFRFVPK